MTYENEITELDAYHLLFCVSILLSNVWIANISILYDKAFLLDMRAVFNTPDYYRTQKTET